jgi:Flp pilus assembly protein TadG
MLVGAAVDLGTAIDRSIRLENAARTGAQYATRAPDDTAGAQAVALAALTAIPGWGSASVTVSAAACECLGANGAGAGSPSAGACGTSCPNGQARYITVTATRPFVPIFPTSAIIPFNNLGASSSNVVARL